LDGLGDGPPEGVLTIVWDVDDVLNALMRDWFEQWKLEHPHCRQTYAGLKANPPHDVLGISRQEYLDSLDCFRLSEAARHMEPNPEILDWLRVYGSNFRHVALTARPLDTAPAAAEWVMRYFGDYIRAFGVVPCRSLASTPRYDESKGDFLAWWNQGDILVDDCSENIASAEKAGVVGVLYPQPWNDSRARALEGLTEAVLRNRDRKRADFASQVTGSSGS
jgi:hypothetical protein